MILKQRCATPRKQESNRKNREPIGYIEFGHINSLRFVLAKVLDNKNNWLESYVTKGFKKKRKFEKG